jgi:hypothetical protein
LDKDGVLGGCGLVEGGPGPGPGRRRKRRKRRCVSFERDGERAWRNVSR